MRALAKLFNVVPVRWQRRALTAAHERFLVGVVGIGAEPDGRVILARHRFGSPEWRFLGGFLAKDERVEDALSREIREETGHDVLIGPLLEASAGYPWKRVELVYAYRITGGTERLSGEVRELGRFAPDALPEIRSDQRAIVERQAARAVEWARAR